MAKDKRGNKPFNQRKRCRVAIGTYRHGNVYCGIPLDEYGYCSEHGKQAS